MLVSVVIPSYNHSLYVIKAIESVLAQDWPKIDLIVIDDGSKDDSVEKINKFLKEKGGFRFIARENRGLVKTLNEGLELANGEFFCLCASDDYLADGSIRKRAEYLSSHPECVAVFANAAQVSDEGDITGYLVREEQKNIFSAEDPIPFFLKGRNLPIHGLMSRRQTFKAIGGFDTRFSVCEDLDIQLLHFLQGSVNYIDEVVYFYRWHGDNTSYNIRQIARGDIVLLFKKYLEEVPPLKPYRRLIKRTLRHQFLRMGRYLHAIHGGTPKEKQIFRGAWKYAWQDPRLLWYLLLYGR